MSIDVTKIKAVTLMPTIQSNDSQWITWADSVIGKYGSTLGKQIFIKTWEKRGSRAANTRTIRVHLKDKYDIEIDESIWDKVVDIGGGISDGFSSFMKVGKITAFVLAGVVGLVVIGIVYNVVKNPIGTLTPQGRIRGGLK
jgi:hypothetical protein